MGIDYANEICNHFFQLCDATISKRDYDYVKNILKIIEEKTIEEFNKNKLPS